jgi:hypothetical protein
LRRAFPILLLFTAAFFLLGRIGFWSDDYWHNLRDPATLELPRGGLAALTMRRGFFLRPLFYIIAPLITTLSWSWQWPAHLLMALGHGAVALVLYRLLRRLAVPAAAASAASLLFMLYPVQFEAVLWTAAFPTQLATLLMLWIGHMQIAMARSPRALSWRLPVISSAAFALCCLNEQPAAGIPALPLLYLAAARGPNLPLTPGPEPGEAGGTGGLCPRRVLRPISAALAASLAALLYLFLLKRGIPALGILPAPPGARGAADTLISLSALPSRARGFVRDLLPFILMHDFASGALRAGLATIRTSGIAGAAAIGLLVASAIPWGSRWFAATADREPRATGDPSNPARPSHRSSRLLLAAAFGLAVYIIGFLPPMLIASYTPDSRLLYWPSTGLAIALAALGTVIARALPGSPNSRWRRMARAVAAAILCLTLLTWAVSYIGLQSAFRGRWRLDQSQGAALRSAFPDAAPFTFFLPLGSCDRDRRGNLGADPEPPPAARFESHFRPVWEFPWATPKFIKTAFGRDDVRCGHAPPGATLRFERGSPVIYHLPAGHPILGADESGIHYAQRLGPRFPAIEGSGSRVPWDRAAPFAIDEAGGIQPVGLIVIQEPGKPDLWVQVPQAKDSPRGIIAIALPRS